VPRGALAPLPPDGRILLVRLSAIGDVVNVLPALALLRDALPGAHLAFLVEDRAAALVEGHPLLDEVIVFPRRRWRAWLRDPRRWAALAREVAAQRRALRGRRFDAVLDFQGNLKGAVHALATGASRRIGFARGHDREGSHLVATEVVVPPADRPHRVDKFAAIAEALGATSGERRYVLPSPPAVRARIDARLAERGISPDGPPFVVLHPGTSERGAAKRWPIDRFGELARLVRDRFGVRVLVTSGPGEEPLARAVCDGASGAAELAPPTESLLELAELLRRARLFVGADTGPMHLAAASGTRCVALFGPKDPAVYGPYGPGHAVVRGESKAGASAMEAISVEQVLAAVAGALADRAGPEAAAAALPRSPGAARR